MIVVALVAAIVEFARTRTRPSFGFLVARRRRASRAHEPHEAHRRPAPPDIAQLTGFSGSSFPSGHAATAAATFAAVALLVGRGRSPRVKALLAGRCGRDRGRGRAHAGAARRALVHRRARRARDGWAWFALCSIAFGGRVLRFGRPVEIGRKWPPRLLRAER